VIVLQTTLHMRNLFLAEADLARASAGITNSQDGYRVTLAAVALGAAGAVTDDAFEQGAAEEVSGFGET
jgi:hypothetical protein